MLQLLAASLFLLAPTDTIVNRTASSDSIAPHADSSVMVVSQIDADAVDSIAKRTSTVDTSAARARSLVEQRTVGFSFPEDTNPRRRAIALSDWYGRRLTIHRIGSYTMLPLFVGQFLLGNELLKQKRGTFDGTRLTPVNDNLLTAHKYVAAGVGTLFAVNGFTGLWNLYEARHVKQHRALRYTHALLMVSSEAGFVVTGIAAKNAFNRRVIDAEKHRNYALGSMAIAVTGVSLMWFGNHD